MCEKKMSDKRIEKSGGSVYAEGSKYSGFTQRDKDIASQHMQRPLEPVVHTGNITDGLELMEARAQATLSKKTSGYDGVFVMDDFLNGRYFAPAVKLGKRER